MIDIHNLWFKYAGQTKWALRDVNLHVDRGECVGIMGQNGAGKSTLIRHLNGLLLPTEGDVFIGNANTRYLSVAKLSQQVGIVFQNPDHQLFADTVADELKFSLKTLEIPIEQKENQRNSTVTEFELNPFLGRSPFNLSGGERKRVSIASLYCRFPEILVLDEPTLGQDFTQKARIARLVNQLTDQGTIVIIVTHDLEFAAQYLDRLLIIHDGRLVTDGNPRDIFSNSNVLDRSALREPQITRLSKLFHEKHPDFPVNILTIKEFLTEFKRVISRKDIDNKNGGSL